MLLLAAAAENRRWFLGVGVWVEKELGRGLLEFTSVEVLDTQSSCRAMSTFVSYLISCV